MDKQPNNLMIQTTKQSIIRQATKQSGQKQEIYSHRTNNQKIKQYV